MKKSDKKIIPITRADAGKPVLIRIPFDLVDALKAIGRGKTATAINRVLETYKEEILEAAEEVRSAS